MTNFLEDRARNAVFEAVDETVRAGVDADTLKKWIAQAWEQACKELAQSGTEVFK